MLCRRWLVSVYVGVFGKKLRADRRYLSTNVNLFELGGVREEEDKGTDVSCGGGAVETLNFCFRKRYKEIYPVCKTVN